MSGDKGAKPEAKPAVSSEERREAIRRLREICKGSLPADFKFDREEANSRPRTTS